MKKLFLALILLSHLISAQTPDATIKTNTNTWIRTAPLITGANEATLFDQINNSKISRLENYTASGTNTYTVSIGWVTSYQNLTTVITFTNANTGVATLNINGLGAKAIKKLGSNALVLGDIKAGQSLWLHYDGTNFQTIGGGIGLASLSASSPINYNSGTGDISFPSWPSNSLGVLTNNGSGTLSWGTGGTVAHANNGVSLSGDTVQLGNKWTKPLTNLGSFSGSAGFFFDSLGTKWNANSANLFAGDLINYYSYAINGASADSSPSGYIDAYKNNHETAIVATAEYTSPALGIINYGIGANYSVRTTIHGGNFGSSIERFGIDTVGNILIKPNGTTGTNGKVLTSDASGYASWQTPAAGVTTFVALTDGPGSFSGKTLNFTRVNAGETALEYRTPSQVRSDIGAGTGDGTVTSIATTSPITGGTITTTGTIACATCVTSAASLTSNAIVIGGGSQATSTTTTGTGVLTAIGVNTGSPGAFVVNGGALGTPSSGTATNLTSIPVANATGVLPAANGGAGTINGLLKANGSGAVSQAIERTDYAAANASVSSTTTTTSITPDPTTYDIYDITALASALTINNPSVYGNGYAFIIRIKDNGTARALTWGGQYRVVGGSLPSTTTISTTLYIPTMYNFADSKWDVLMNATGTTNEIAYFSNPTTLNSLTTATYPSLTELSYVKGVTSNIQTQINSISGGWAVTGTTTLTGASTVSSITPDGLFFTNTSTATANNQSIFKIGGTFTSRNTASDTYNGLVISPTLNGNAGAPAGLTANAVLINPTFSLSATANILKLQNAGTDRYIFGSSVAKFTNNVNGTNSLELSNSTSGTSSRVGFLINSSSVGGSLYAHSAGYTTSGINEANSMVLQNTGVLNMGGSSTSLWTAGVKRLNVSSNGFFTFTPGTLTGLQSAAEFNDYTYESANHTWVDGTITNQRWAWFKSPSLLGTTTLATATNGYTVYIDKPLAGSLGAITNPFALGIAGDLALLDGNNMVGGTSTGNKLMTSTSQKLGIWNATPIVQPANTVAIDDVLINTGLRASGGSANFTLKITNSLPQNLKNYTVSTLPSGVRGDMAYVTDALTPSFLVIVVGGGSTVTPVFYDGTNWVVF